jgi:putative oxidoreductase
MARAHAACTPQGRSIVNFLDTYRSQIFAAARIAFGVMFASHGLQKVFMIFGGAPPGMDDAARYVIGGIELVGGVMIAVGFKTRLAAFICSGQMAVAYFAVHQKGGLLPIQNHGELSALYCWGFLMIASVRDWIWAVDSASDSA